ncbi:ABC transporter permease [Verrucomicrobiota bacterium]
MNERRLQEHEGTGPRRMGRQRQLPLHSAVKIAWQNIRVRLSRSLLVTSGIVLAITFLAYILYSNALLQSVVDNGSDQLLDRLRMRGTFTMPDQDAMIRTRWLVGLSLLVCLVGILNAMCLSVTERFREIGTMKCLGALDKLVVQLFLLESTFQGIVGTATGVLIGLALALVEGAGLVGMEMWGMIPFNDIMRIAGICLVSGLALTVAGAFYPALVAARMQPVAALRSEV